MKRMLPLPAALLLLCAACTTAPTNTANTNANTNAANINAANANSRAAAAWTNDDVIANDRAAWDAIKRKDSAAFSDLLAPEFIDVTPEGIFDRAGTVDSVKALDLSDVTLGDFHVIRINDAAAVVTYSVSLKGSEGGRPIPADNKAYHSTAQVWRGGKWLAVYHQSTPQTNAPPTPAPAAASPSPAASAATAASTPAATTADAEANEKLVWDALKRKDWNAFAGYLAEDQIEVWGTGRLDKAKSVEGVKSVDFSSFALSDFKTVPLDADAKLVVYKVRGTGPDGKPVNEYGSSIWASRGGRWLAVFHQGTPIAPAAR